MDAGGNNRYQRGCNRTGRQLQEEAANWQTPGTDSFRSRGGDRIDEMGLDQQARTWQTPRAHEAGSFTRDHGVKGMERETLTGQSEKWATPDAPTGGSRTRSPEAMERAQHSSGSKMQITLQDQASQWATPRATEGGPDFAKEERSTTGAALPAMAATWPTVTTMDGEQAGGRGRKERRGKTTLSLETENWPTCQSRDYKSGETQKDYGNSRPLTEAVLQFSLLGQKTPDGPKFSKGPRGSRLRLNVLFAEWLMSAPIGWTNST